MYLKSKNSKRQQYGESGRKGVCLDNVFSHAIFNEMLKIQIIVNNKATVIHTVTYMELEVKLRMYALKGSLASNATFKSF